MGEGGGRHIPAVWQPSMFAQRQWQLWSHFQRTMSWQELLQTSVIYTHHYQHKLAQGYKIYNSTTSEIKKILPSRVCYQITWSSLFFELGCLGYCVCVHVQTEVQASGGQAAH